jgi:hypothetical protein
MSADRFAATTGYPRRRGDAKELLAGTIRQNKERTRLGHFGRRVGGQFRHQPFESSVRPAWRNIISGRKLRTTIYTLDFANETFYAPPNPLVEPR